MKIYDFFQKFQPYYKANITTNMTTIRLLLHFVVYSENLGFFISA